MTLFQLILLAAAVFFAYQVYKHSQTLRDDAPKLPSEPEMPDTPAQEPAAPADPLLPSRSDLIQKADAAYEKGDLAEARFYLERAEKLDHDDVAVLVKLAYILDRAGETEEALAKYAKALRLDPDDDITHHAMAEILRKLGRLDEAQEHLKSAADIDDGFELTYYNYGLLLIDKQDFEGAKMMLEKALELKPDYTEAREALERL